MPFGVLMFDLPPVREILNEQLNHKKAASLLILSKRSVQRLCNFFVSKNNKEKIHI